MRLRKAIASFFLIFAGITLLAHTIIPHHHHEDTSVVLLNNFLKPYCYENAEKSHCTEHSSNNCNTDDCSIPDRDCQDSSKNCTDANIVLKGGEDAREELIVATNELIPLLLLFSSEDIGDKVTDSNVSYLYKNYHLPSYTDYIPDSQGLRAPPVC